MPDHVEFRGHCLEVKYFMLWLERLDLELGSQRKKIPREEWYHAEIADVDVVDFLELVASTSSTSRLLLLLLLLRVDR